MEQKEREIQLVNEQKEKEEEMLMQEKQYQSLQAEVEDMRILIRTFRLKYKQSLQDLKDL